MHQTITHVHLNNVPVRTVVVGDSDCCDFCDATVLNVTRRFCRSEDREPEAAAWEWIAQAVDQHRFSITKTAA